MLKYFIFIFSFFNAIAAVYIFKPPSKCVAASVKNDCVKAQYAYKSEHGNVVLNFALEPVTISLNEYIDAIGELSSIKRLGSISSKSSKGELIRVITDNNSAQVFQAVFVEEGTAYIITASVPSKDLSSVRKDMMQSFRSFEKIDNVYASLSQGEVDKLHSIAKSKSLKELAQYLYKKHSKLGYYWQCLILEAMASKAK